MNYAVSGAPDDRWGRWSQYYRDRWGQPQSEGGLTEASRLMYQLDPEMLYRYFMGFGNPSNQEESAMMRLYPSLYERYKADVADRGAQGSQDSFANFLGSVDFDRELASMSPLSRGGDAINRYYRPARTVAF
jgi:hypothetical protein